MKKWPYHGWRGRFFSATFTISRFFDDDCETEKAWLLHNQAAVKNEDLKKVAAKCFENLAATTIYLEIKSKRSRKKCHQPGGSGSKLPSDRQGVMGGLSLAVQSVTLHSMTQAKKGRL